MPVIGISGSYGGLNLGDEAILASAVVQLRAHLPDVEVVVFSRDAQHTREHHAVDRVLCPRTALRDEILPEVSRLDLLLLGGGGILYDTEARAYLREVVLAHECGVPTFAFAIGAGPLDDLAERRAVRDGLDRMAGITVREISAKRLFEDIGISIPIEVTADPAFLLQPKPAGDEILRRNAVPLTGPLVGLSVREQGAAAPDLDHISYHRLLANTADFIIRRYDARVVFVPMEAADVREAHLVLSAMGAIERAYVLNYDYGPQQALDLMRHFEIAVGMRLHFLIFAAVSGVPLAALPYAPKVADLMDMLDAPWRPATRGASAGEFLADLDRLWDHRNEHRARLRERVLALQEQAARTVPLAIAHLRARSAAPDANPTGEPVLARTEPAG